MLKKWIPSIQWLGNYDKNNLKSDLSAGLIVAVMLIPQGMAYAMLAGLPPVIGLYSSTIPLIVYALLGSSRQLAVGPVAIVSILVLTGVSGIAEPGSESFIRYVFLLSLMVGVFTFAMGVFRLGFLVNFLSHAVISGFTSAAAIIIGLSQLKQLLGIKLENTESVFLLLIEAVRRMGEANPITLAIGLGSILILIISRKLFRKFPAPLLVVILSTVIVYLFRLDQYGVSIVGKVPGGLPAFSLPAFSMESISALLPTALTITFVGFMESIAVAKSIAAKEKYKVNANQELNGLGLANIAGSFFSAYPVTGGFSRTAVNYQSGAKTGLASIITASLIILTLLFFTGIFYYLPNAALAAIIIVAVYGLIDVKEAIHLFKLKTIDGVTLLVTFLLTLTVGIEKGILLGAAFSLLVFIWRSAYPHVAELGYLEKEKVFRNLKRYPQARTFPNTFIYRIDASLYFANMSFLEDQLENEISRTGAKNIILDFSGVNDMDAVAIDHLSEMIDNYQKQGVNFIFASMKGPVRDLVAKAGWKEKYGAKIEPLSIQQALELR